MRDGTTKDEVYLGDGLYATFDGWQIILRAPRGDSPDHLVALEPETFATLVRFAALINKKYNVKHFDALTINVKDYGDDRLNRLAVVLATFDKMGEAERVATLKVMESKYAKEWPQGVER